MREICFYAGLATLVFMTVIASTALAALLVREFHSRRPSFHTTTNTTANLTTNWQERCDELNAYIRHGERGSE